MTVGGTMNVHKVQNARTIRDSQLKRVFQVATDNPLFKGVDHRSFEAMLACMSARILQFRKGDTILLTGDPVKSVGLVLSGSVQVIKEDLVGRFTILEDLTTADTFCESFACARIAHSPVTISATCDTEVLLLDLGKVVYSCDSNCPFHAELINNLLKVVARKNLGLMRKAEILSKKTTREKLLTYFDTQRGSAKKFTIPFSREELSHYLCVDRSAMSRELSKMRNEGLISYNKNNFEIL